MFLEVKARYTPGAKLHITRDSRMTFVISALINIDSKLILWVWLLVGGGGVLSTKSTSLNTPLSIDHCIVY